MITLRDYQLNMVRETIKRKRVLIIAPMGSGKTVATLSAISMLILKGEIKRCLIVAPLRVAMNVWEDENRRHDMGLNIRYCKTGLDVKLFLSEPLQHHIAVCSVSRIHEIPHGCWDMNVGDEYTLFGNPSSQRSKEQRRLCNKVPIRIGLTGTPIHGGYEKLWHQCFLLDGGAALGKNITAFRNKYMQIKYQMHGVTTVYEINPAMIPQIHCDIKHLVMVVKNDVSLSLPPLFVKDIYIDLPKKRMDEYKELEMSSVIGFEAETGMKAYQDEHAIISFSAASRGSKLRQLASGMVYTHLMSEDENDVPKVDKTKYAVTHREKIEAVKEVVESAPRGIMIAYQFQSELAELKKAFPKAITLKTNEDIEAWNTGQAKVILVHPDGAAWGLNLQFGGNIIVWFSLTYNAETYAQLNKRLHRQGQKDPVTLVRLLARDTIDEKVKQVLEIKERHSKEFLKL